jgi:hypothetical protein
MSRLDEVAERDGKRCWLCDEPDDPEMSVNDDRCPSVDSLTTKAAKGKIGAGAAERLGRKGGRAVVAQCPSRADADQIADWLVDRFSPGTTTESVNVARRVVCSR